MLWELYTGSPLFQGDTTTQMLYSIHKHIDLTVLNNSLALHGAGILNFPQGPRASFLRPGMPADFAEMLQHCLKQPTEQRASAAELLVSR